MKIAVIGRGAIGLTCAYEISKSGGADVTVFGSSGNSYTASRAAGAMLNIVSEIDTFNSSHPLTRWKLANKSLVIKLWDDLMNRLVGDRAIPNSLLFGLGTQILINSQTSNKVELSSYDAMKDIYVNNCVGSENNVSTIATAQGRESFLIGDEQSVDSHAFLEGLESYLRTFSSIVNCDVLRIFKEADRWCIEASDGQFYAYDYVVLCAGSWSESIIDRSPCLKKPTRRSFFGVGSALLVSSELEYVKQPTFDRIFRTPNRGGTCGIHSVQRKDSLYVGASSVVTNKQLKSARMSSINALVEGLREDLGVDIYQLSSQVITGYRPVTDDAVPVIGELESGLFCCYGTKRDGFTWSPLYAKNIANTILNPGNPSAEWEELLDQCSPQRRYTTAGEPELCIENYVVNKIFESHQHGKELQTQDIDLLYSVASKVHLYLEDEGGCRVGVQPELVNMFYYVIMNQS
jgi:glycine oxidase